LHTALRAQSAPGFPCALYSKREQRNSKTRAKTLPRERERMVFRPTSSFRLNPVSIRNKY
jgi:hypothetical protein